MRRFRNLNVWSNSYRLCLEIYSLTDHFPSEEKFGLTNQIRRAAISIPSNIAEGASRGSNKEFSRFLEISLGSAFELETQLEISRDLKYLSPDNFQNLYRDLTQVQKQLGALRKAVQN